MKVFVFYRNSYSAFSIENLFRIVIKYLPSFTTAQYLRMPFLSTGVLKRIANMVWAFFHRGEVNHITGDVHYIALTLPPSRTILTIHDCGTVLAEKNPVKRIIIKWLWFVLPVWWVRRVTVISEQTKLDLIGITNCPEEKIVVIPNCIDPRFTPQERAFNTERPAILHIGTKKNKNLLRLAEALSGIPCLLHIIGFPDEETNIALRRYNIDHRVSSRLSFDEMLRAYHESDMVAFASTYEGFGLPILEGQAVGRVVVTSKISPMKEVAGGGAMLVDPFDVASIRSGIFEVIKNGGLRQELIEKGLVNVSRYSPTNIAAQYAAQYVAIIKKKECAD